MSWLALRSLRSRWSRALAAIVGASIAISIAYVLTGVTNAFNNETSRALDALGTHFLIPEGSSGLLTGVVFVADGPAGADPVVFARDSLPAKDVDVNIFGVTTLATDLSSGRMFTDPGEVVLDESAGLGVGDTFRIAGRDLEVVGLTTGIRIFAGGPVAFVPLETVQQLYFNEQPVAAAFASADRLTAPEGLKEISAPAAKKDIDRAVKGAISTIALTRTLLWVMVAGIVFILIRLNMLERKPELATLKCLGVGTRAIGVSLVFESVLVGLLGGISGCIAGLALTPLFALAVETSWSDAFRITLLAIGVSLIAALSGTLQVRNVAPSDAFRGEI